VGLQHRKSNSGPPGKLLQQAVRGSPGAQAGSWGGGCSPGAQAVGSWVVGGSPRTQAACREREGGAGCILPGALWPCGGQHPL
jgi:hypothetical protein